MTPKEQAIEKLAKVMLNAYNKYHAIDGDLPYMPDFIKDSCFYPQAEAVIDALGVEVVSWKGIIKKGDVVECKSETSPIYFSYNKVEKNNDESSLNSRCIELEFNVPTKHNLCRILESNNKPAVYVENIKGEENVS